MNKFITIIVGILILVGGILIGHSFWPTHLVVGASPVNSTFNTQKVAAIVALPATAAATTTSILNTDANDRWVTSSFAYCGAVGTSLTAYTGAGLAALTLQAATSSTAAPSTLSNTNFTLSVTISTSTPDSTVSTSTFGTAFWQRWASGSYMTYVFNATNTAVCTVGSNYVPS